VIGAVGEADRFKDRWDAYAEQGGALHKSKLTCPVRLACGMSYTVVLKPGLGTFEAAVEQRARIASALGVHRNRVLFERAAWLGDEGRFKLTIVDRDGFQVRRLAGEPRVRDGVLLDLGGYPDGDGEFAVTMWSSTLKRMVPVGLAGDPGTGLSNAVRQLLAGASRSGVMNAMVIDPSGFRESALRPHARVALSGPQAADQVWSVLDRLVEARRQHAAAIDATSLLPSAELPGWVLIFADVNATLANPAAAARMRAFLRDSDHLGFWPVAVAGSVAPDAWGGQEILSRFSEQALAFWTGTWWPGAMGVDLARASWPLDDHGVPVPGWATPGFGPRRSVTMRWYWQPRDAEEVVCDEEAAARDVIARFRRDAPVAAIDAAALVKELGGPSGGRWERGLV
jgi:hypothetical protein